MRSLLDIAADNLTIWRESSAQALELRTLQAKQLGERVLTQEDAENAIRALWPKKADEGAASRANELAEQLAFSRGILHAHSREQIWRLLLLPHFSPAPAAPRVVFLDSAFGREALKRFEKLIPHSLPVTAPSFTAVCEELAGDRADFALLPLEDSHEGRFLHLYEEIDRFELRITHSCTVPAEDGHSVLMALLSLRYAPAVTVDGVRFLSCAVLEEDSHALCDILTSARACGLTLRRVDTLPVSYGENVAIYHPLFTAPDEARELLFLLHLALFQPRARATARYIHLKGERNE